MDPPRMLIVVLLVAAAPTVARAQIDCADTPSVQALWAALPDTERVGLTLELPVRTALAELDRSAPLEALLAVDALGDGSAPGRSIVWALRCRGGAWSPIDHVELPIDRAWDGTYDELPGVRVLRAERIPGIAHDLARIEHVDVRGGHDPRYVARRLLYLHVVDDALVVALDTVLRNESASGPARETTITQRAIVLPQRVAARPRAGVRVIETDSRGRARTVCRTTLAWWRGAFVPTDPSCH